MDYTNSPLICQLVAHYFNVPVPFVILSATIVAWIILLVLEYFSRRGIGAILAFTIICFSTIFSTINIFIGLGLMIVTLVYMWVLYIITMRGSNE